MDPDNEVESFLGQGNEEDEKKMKWKRPPSSYGSMKSDSDDEMEEKEENEENVAVADSSPCPVLLPDPTALDETRLRMIRSESPETLYTMTTQQTRPLGGLVIETRLSDLGNMSEENDEEDMDEVLVTNSPEPPEFVEPDDPMTDENSQPGKLHPEQDLGHLFKTIQNTLSKLTEEELFKFKMSFYQWEPAITLQQTMEGDMLDFVDRILELLGQDRVVLHVLRTLEVVNKKEESEDLRNQLKRFMTRFYLKQYLIRKHQVIREGVVRAGKQNLLDTIYVEPHISTCGHGGVDPSHELPQPPTHLQVPTEDTFVSLNNLFRLQKEDGTPVRTVLTTGLPGIGLSVSVGKFCLDWAEFRSNKDLQFVIKLSFRSIWYIRNKKTPRTPTMSIMEVLEYRHHEFKDIQYLEEEDCKFLIIMDSFDCYQAHLDWENAPVINDNYTQAPIDVLVVNIIRGTVLRGARVWILGRRAAVSQIPLKFIDVVTEIQGFSDEMKDEFLEKRFYKKDLGASIVAHYKRQPMLQMLCRQPFVSWMVSAVFERCYRYLDYGAHPPRLTPFCVSIMTVQTNRRLQFYYDKSDNDLKWSNEDKHLLMMLGKMALKMLERKTSVFYEEDVKDCGMNLTEVTVWSGICTELPSAASDGKRRFCFIHLTMQEFMAALYVYHTFRTESKNVLDSRSKILAYMDNNKTPVGMIQCALTRVFGSHLGHWDMFLRFLCGLHNTDCHEKQLCGYLYSRNSPKMLGLDDVQKLLEQSIRTAEEKHRDRVENLKECLREMTQEDE